MGKKGRKNAPKMFKCVMCNFTALKGQLLEHVIKAHVPTERAPWSCSSCGFRAISRNALVNHERSPIHKNSLKRNPNVVCLYVKAKNPYMVREGIDFIPVDDGRDWNYEEGGSCKKRRFGEPSPCSNNMRADNNFGHQNEYDFRERPDRPNYDITDGDFNMYDSTDYESPSYNEMTNNRFYRGNNQRYQTRFTSSNIQENVTAFNFNRGMNSNQSRIWDANTENDPSMLRNIGGLFDTSDVPPLLPELSQRSASFVNQCLPTQNVTGMDRRDTGLGFPVRTATSTLHGYNGTAKSSLVDTSINHNSYIDARHNVFDSRQVSKNEFDQSVQDVACGQKSTTCLAVEEVPIIENRDPERMPACSSTVGRHVDNTLEQDSNQTRSAQHTEPQKADNQNSVPENSGILQDKVADQSTEIGSSCGTNRERDTPEVVSVPEISSAQKSERRRFKSGASSVTEQEQTDIDDGHQHDEVEGQEGDELSESQILEDKMTELINALDPLKNISKALIALDHHMRRLLPMVEHLTKDIASERKK